jgi:hypothetical protein
MLLGDVEFSRTMPGGLLRYPLQGVNRRPTWAPPRLSIKSLKQKRNCLFRACSIGVELGPPPFSLKSFNCNGVQRIRQGSKLDAESQFEPPLEAVAALRFWPHLLDWEVFSCAFGS